MTYMDIFLTAYTHRNILTIHKKIHCHYFAAAGGAVLAEPTCKADDGGRVVPSFEDNDDVKVEAEDCCVVACLKGEYFIFISLLITKEANCTLFVFLTQSQIVA